MRGGRQVSTSTRVELAVCRPTLCASMGSNLIHERDDWAVAGQCTCKRQYFPASFCSGSTSSSSSPTSSAGARASHIPSWPCLSSRGTHHQPTSEKKKKRCVCTPTPTSKEDQVHGGIRMVRGTIHPILRHLCPRDDLHVLQSLAQRLDLRLFLIILLEHERVLIGRAPRVACLQ